MPRRPYQEPQDCPHPLPLSLLHLQRRASKFKHGRAAARAEPAAPTLDKNAGGAAWPCAAGRAHGRATASSEPRRRWPSTRAGDRVELAALPPGEHAGERQRRASRSAAGRARRRASATRRRRPSARAGVHDEPTTPPLRRAQPSSSSVRAFSVTLSSTPPPCCSPPGTPSPPAAALLLFVEDATTVGLIIFHVDEHRRPLHRAAVDVYTPSSSELQHHRHIFLASSHLTRSRRVTGAPSALQSTPASQRHRTRRVRLRANHADALDIPDHLDAVP